MAARSNVPANGLAGDRVSLRRTFPGFARVYDGLCGLGAILWELIANERVALLTTATGWVVLTLVVSFLTGFLDYRGRFEEYAELLALVFIAQAGIWTSVGRGAWHYRLPLGAFAGAWVLAARLAALNAGPHPVHANDYARLATVAPVVLIVSAFGAALFHSIASQELRGPIAPLITLRRGQFNLRTVFWSTLLVAAVVGLWQASRPWAGNLDFDLRRLDYVPTSRLAVVAASGAALLALIGGFRRWQFALPVLVCGLAIVALSDCFGFTAPQGRRIARQLQLGLFLPTSICLLPALATIAWLRWLGFRLESVRA